MSQQQTQTVPTAQEFQNERVHFKVHHKPHCLVEYEVEAFSSITHEAYQKAVRTVGKDVVAPGFRKGRAPAEIIEKRYGSELDRKWQDAIANLAYRECHQLAKIPLLKQDSTISYKMGKHNKEKATLTLIFETAPVVPSIDPKKLHLKPTTRPEVNPEKIEETIRQARLFFAEWKNVTDRAVQEGDYIILDVDVIEEPEQKLFSNTRFEVTDKSMAKWMKDLVLGRNIGENVEGTSVPDANLPEEEKAQFSPKKVRLHIKAIEEATLPPLDDAFAKQIGVSDVEELYKRIEKLLNHQADAHVRELMREEVTDFLLTSHPFDLPRSVIEKETQFRMEQLMQDPSFKKQWNAMLDKERKEMVSNVMGQAERAVKMFYLCRKIAADANISVTAKDIPAPVTDPLEALLNPRAMMHDPRQPDIKQAEAFSRVLIEKTEDWVIDHAHSKSNH